MVCSKKYKIAILHFHLNSALGIGCLNTVWPTFILSNRHLALFYTQSHNKLKNNYFQILKLPDLDCGKCRWKLEWELSVFPPCHLLVVWISKAKVLLFLLLAIAFYAWLIPISNVCIFQDWYFNCSELPLVLWFWFILYTYILIFQEFMLKSGIKKIKLSFI